MKYITNANMITNSHITGNMLTQTLPGQRGPFDPQTFIQQLQGQLIRPVIALWNNPQIKYLPANFIVSLITSTKQLLDGQTTSKNQSKEEKKTPAPPTFQPDANLVNQLMEMGFSRSHCEDALRQIGANNAAIATEWLLSNPEEIIPEETENKLPEEETNEDVSYFTLYIISLYIFLN